jgi:hypothetical protein
MSPLPSRKSTCITRGIQQNLPFSYRTAKNCAEIRQEIIDSLSSPVQKIFSSSLNNGEFPDFWKSSHITPIFKDGNRRNINKTKAMCITLNKNYSPECLVVKVNGMVVEFVDKIKYLGVMIDQKLRFEQHCDYICKKMLKKYHLIKHLSPKLTFWSKLLLYKSLVAIHLEFCSSVLFLLNKGQMNKLQKVQNRCMRLILKVKWDTPRIAMLEALNFQSVRQRIYFNTLKFMGGSRALTNSIEFRHAKDVKTLELRVMN